MQAPGADDGLFGCPAVVPAGQGIEAGVFELVVQIGVAPQAAGGARSAVSTCSASAEVASSSTEREESGSMAG